MKKRSFPIINWNFKKTKVMKNIPYILIATRFILAPLILSLAYVKGDES